MKVRFGAVSSDVLAAGVLVLLALGLSSCATTGGRGSVREPIARADIPVLRVGQSWSELRSQLGRPHESVPLEFGEVTDEPWSAWMAVYWGPPDPHFVEIEHPLKHRLVFAIVEGDTLLDHWVLAEEPAALP